MKCYAAKLYRYVLVAVPVCFIYHARLWYPCVSLYLHCFLVMSGVRHAPRTGNNFHAFHGNVDTFQCQENIYLHIYIYAASVPA